MRYATYRSLLKDLPMTLPALPRNEAARHVLASPSIAARTAPYIGDGRIDWHGILAETATMSGGERFLVDLARRLSSGKTLPSAYEVSGQLDVRNARHVAEVLDHSAGAASADLPLAA